MYKKIFLTYILLFFSNYSLANNDLQSKKEVLEITNVWTRKSIPPVKNSASYMHIYNPNDQDVIIVGSSANSVANHAELHKSFVDENGIGRMTSIDKIIVPAKSSIELKPAGIHIMLFDLKKHLSINDKFNIKIKIENGNDIETISIVK